MRRGPDATGTARRGAVPVLLAAAVILSLIGVAASPAAPPAVRGTKPLTLVVWPERDQMVEREQMVRYGFDVRDPSGAEVPEARVRVTDRAQGAAGTASGTYELCPSSAGSFKLTFRAEATGYASSEAVDRTLHVTEPGLIPTEIVLKYPMGDIVRQGKPFEVRASLVSAQGGTVSGAALVLSLDEDSGSWQSATAEDGAASFSIPTDNLPKRSHTIRVAFRGGTVGGRGYGGAERLQNYAFLVAPPLKDGPALRLVKPPSPPPYAVHLDELLQQGRFEDARHTAKGMTPGYPAESPRVRDALDDVVRHLPDQTGSSEVARLLRRSVQGFLLGGATGERQAMLCSVYANQVSSGTAGAEWMRFLKGEYPGLGALVLPRVMSRPLMEQYLEVIDSPLSEYGYEDKFRACENILVLDPAHLHALRVLGSVHFAQAGRLRKSGEEEKAREEFERCRLAWETVCRTDPQDAKTRQFLQAVERLLAGATAQEIP